MRIVTAGDKDIFVSIKTFFPSADHHHTASHTETIDLLSNLAVDIFICTLAFVKNAPPEFLRDLRDRFPAVTRIIAEDDSEKEYAAVNSDVVSHFLPLPFSEAQLKEVVDRDISIRKRLKNQGLINLMKNIKTLPILPVSYRELRYKLGEDVYDSAEVAEYVRADIGLVTRIMKLANSSLFSGEQITTIESAIKAIGRKNVKALLLTDEVFATFDISEHADFHIEDLWTHCIHVALCARAIAVEQGEKETEADQAFLAGLLHDVGMLVLVHLLKEHFKVIITFMEREKRHYLDSEFEMFDFSHADIGGYLLDSWGLNPLIVEAVAFHHKPELSGVTTPGTLAYVHCANTFEKTWGEASKLNITSKKNSKWLNSIGLDDKTLLKWKNICEKVQADV